MAKETERKFLVTGEFRHLAIEKTEILQYYITSDINKTIRIRITGNNALLTFKGRAPVNTITRDEWEFNIPVDAALEMLALCIPGRIEKTRYIVPSGAHEFEVDEFHGKNEGLIIAEIELSSENQEFERPDWLGEEVTGKPGYYNVNLLK